MPVGPAAPRCAAAGHTYLILCIGPDKRCDERVCMYARANMCLRLLLGVCAWMCCLRPLPQAAAAYRPW